MTFEFKATVMANGQVALPSHIAGQVPAGSEVDVTLSWEAPLDADSFRTLSQKVRAAAAYAPEDSVFDCLA
jgi:hypothetical protein